jgi:transposase InsO family protein
LPRTRAGYDSIWVVVDRLTKSAHFIPVKTNYNSAVLVELYMSWIVCLHGVPKKIVSDRGTQFTSHFRQQLHEALGTHLNFSSAYHPQTDGQTERTNQIFEDMLRACVLQDQSGWEKRLPYAEFSYNNSYQASLKMSPFQAPMEGVVELHCNGISLEKSKCLGQTFCLKLKRTSRWFGRI